MRIYRYSEVSHSDSIVIDNFNESTQQRVVLERIVPFPYFRVAAYEKNRVAPLGEQFFLDEISANKYWSDLMCAQGALF